jgi:hypothetical protein
MARKRIPTPEEIANDPSLKWCGYRFGELVWSDYHQESVRFVCYMLPSCEFVRLASLNSIAELPGEYHRLTIRRPSVMEASRKPMTESEKRLVAGMLRDRATK